MGVRFLEMEEVGNEECTTTNQVTSKFDLKCPAKHNDDMQRNATKVLYSVYKYLDSNRVLYQKLRIFSLVNLMIRSLQHERSLTKYADSSSKIILL